MSTEKEMRKEIKELKKEVEELKIREKLYLERLENAHDKNHKLRHEKIHMTVDEVVAMQKARADYESEHIRDKEFVDAYEKQQEVKIDGAL